MGGQAATEEKQVEFEVPPADLNGDNSRNSVTGFSRRVPWSDWRSLRSMATLFRESSVRSARLLPLRVFAPSLGRLNTSP